MSTIQRVNFEPKSNILLCDVRDFLVADRTLLDPTGATCFVDGEWVAFDTNGKLVRAASIAGVGNTATTRSFPIFAERGRYDVQVAGKLPIMWLGQYEADTLVFDATRTDAGGAIISTYLQPLKVGTFLNGSRNYCGIIGHGGIADTCPVIGYVTKLPAQNGGKLRFVSGWRF